MREILRRFLNREFFRFLIVGGVNTLLGYGVTLILFYIIGFDYKIAQILNFIICFPIAYTLQTLYAFRKEWSLKRLFIYPISSLPNFILQLITSVICVELLGLEEYIAYLISYIVPIPIMFFVVKFLVTPKEKKERDYDFLRYIIFYTIAFLVVFLLGFKRFFINGKSFIWYLDGVKQHFPFLYDCAEIFKSILKGEGTFPLWNWQLGFGADTIISYSYYVLGDLISLLAGIIFPLDYMELAYSLIVFLRLYLVGLSLLFYCKYMNLREIPSVIGSIIYAFSGHILFWGLRHPFFSNGAIIFPFLAIGVEKIFKENKPTLFIASIGISAINNFYFFYMNTLGIFIYALIRFFYYVEEERFKTFFKILFKFTCYYLVGLSIGAVIFIPSAYGFLNTARVPNIEIKLFDGLKDYLKLFARFVIADKFPRVSLPLIALPSVVMFLHYKDNLSKSFKALFIVFTIFVTLPIFHYAFNAMSAKNDRWVYIYIFILSFVVAYALNYAVDKEWKLSIGMFSVLGAIHYKLSIVFIILFIIGSYYLYKGIYHKVDKSVTQYFQIGILILVMLNLIGNVDTLTKLKNYGGDFKNYGDVIREYREDKTRIASTIDDTDFYRVGYDDYTDNRSLINNFNGTHIYNSIIDKNLITFYDEHNLRQKPTNSAYMGLDGISALNSLLNVKYYIREQGDKDAIPYGFKLKENKENVFIYENKNFMPIAFIYDNYINKEKLKNKPNVDAIYAMMDGAVVEEDIPGVKRGEIKTWSYKLNYEYIEGSGADLKNKEVEVTEDGGSIKLKLRGALDKEVFLKIDRIYYEDKDKNFKLTVESRGVKKSKETRSIKNTYYLDNRDYLYNLGVSEDDELEITISFNRKGKYNFKTLEFLGVSVKDYINQIEQLKSNVLEDIEVNNREIKGTINSPSKSILFLSIPYSKGWTMYVDGKKVETFSVNTAFTGAVIEEGYHEIYLKYTTPYLKLGTLLSFIGLLGLFIISRRS